SEDFAHAVEDAEIQIGKNRTQSKPLFLFSTAEKPAEFEIQSRSTRKYHGNIREFASEFKVQGSKFKDEEQIVVLQSHGIAERLNEILRDYDVSIPNQNLQIGDLSGDFEIQSFDLII